MITQFSKSGISMILDKSAFQSYNSEQLVQLHKYYWVNITPILVMEILGDLNKETLNSVINHQRVTDFAKKLSPFNSSINSLHTFLIEEELKGKTISFYSPMVDTAEFKRSLDGQKFIKINPSVERKAIERWKERDFTKIEELLSSLWRFETLRNDNLSNIKDYLKKMAPELSRLKNQNEIISLIDWIFQTPELHSSTIEFIIKEFSISPSSVSDIFYRWETFNDKKLTLFAPYSLFCLKTKLLFFICLRNGIIGTRPTNLLDLEYVYYLPFCRVFVSDDKFHNQMVPYLLTKDQMYVKGKELKIDLEKIKEIKGTLSGSDLKSANREPPRMKELLSYKIWNKMLVDWPPKTDQSITQDEIDMIDHFITKIRKSNFFD